MSKNDAQTIQEKMAKLDQVVAWFEGDEFVLEHAATLLKEAVTLAREIEHDLNEVSNEVNEVKRSFKVDGGE